MSLCPHGYTAFWDCPTCPEPLGTARVAGDPGDEDVQHECANCRDVTDRYDAARHRWLCGPACVEMFDWRVAEADQAENPPEL